MDGANFYEPIVLKIFKSGGHHNIEWNSVKTPGPARLPGAVGTGTPSTGHMMNAKLSPQLLSINLKKMIFALTDCVLSCVPATPDLALNDYYLWGVALKEIRRVKPMSAWRG